MKINAKHEELAQTARRSLLLASVLGMVLCFAGITRAQSSATTAPAQTAKPAAAPTAPVQTPAAIAKPAATQAKLSSLREEKSPAKGAKEGIVVHGHWTIVVKNPDGTVAARQEFENTLDPIEGADLLTGLLSGEYTTTGFFVDLSSVGSGTLCGASDCLIVDSRNTTNVCAGLSGIGCGTLTYTATKGTANNNAIGFTLSGSVTLALGDGGTINLVGTGIEACLPNLAVANRSGATTLKTSIANAAAESSFVAGAPGAQSNRLISCDSQAGTTGQGTEAGLLLTSRTISQVVSGGQSVSVTVAITFSGS